MHLPKRGLFSLNVTETSSFSDDEDDNFIETFPATVTKERVRWPCISIVMTLVKEVISWVLACILVTFKQSSDQSRFDPD